MDPEENHNAQIGYGYPVYQQMNYTYNQEFVQTQQVPAYQPSSFDQRLEGQKAVTIQSKPLKVMSDYEDNAYIIKSECCLFEFNILHPENHLTMWSNSTSVYGMLKKNSGSIVFNISPMEPVLECCLGSFIVKIRYKIDQDEIKEISALLDLLNPSTKLGNNVLLINKPSEKL